MADLRYVNRSIFRHRDLRQVIVWAGLGEKEYTLEDIERKKRCPPLKVMGHAS